MKRRVNGKFLAGLLASTVAAGGLVYGVHKVQAQRSAAGLLRQADRAEEEGRADKALDYLARYLSYVPGDAKALARYALAVEKRAGSSRSPAARQAVYLTLERALRADPSRADVRRRAAEVAMGLVPGRPDEAQEHLAVLLAATPNDAELHDLKGQCLQALGRDAEARASFERAVRLAPGRLEAYGRLAALLRERLEDGPGADAAIDEMVEANPESYAAYLARWSYNRVRGLPDAKGDVARARELAPDEPDVILAAAQAELAREKPDFDGTRAALERGLARAPEDGRLYLALADLEARARRPGAAAEALRRGVKARPDDLDLLWSLADVLIQQGKPDEATPLLARLREGGYPPEPIALLEAASEVNRGRWLKAAQALEKARPTLTRSPELARRCDLLLGLCYERLGNPDQQYAAYRRAMPTDPLDRAGLPARLGAAAALTAMDKLDDALDLYRSVIPIYDDARITAARLLVLKNLRLPEGRRDWSGVDELLGQADQADAPLLRAEVRVARNDLQGARELLEKARDAHPDRPGLWATLAALADRQGRPEEAVAILDQAASRLGVVPEIRLARIRHWAVLGADPAHRDEAHRALAALDRDVDRLPAAERSSVLRALADAFARTGHAPEAERVLARAAEREPNDLQIRLAQFDLAAEAFREPATRPAAEAAMSRAVEDIQRIEGGDGALGRYAEAARLIRLAADGNPKGLERARSLLAEAAERRPTWSRLAVAQAELDERLNDPERALRGYVRAVAELGERNPAVVRRAVLLLNERRRYAEADQLIRRLQEQAAISDDLKRLAAQVSLSTQDTDRALSLTREITSSGSKDYRDYLVLAQAYWSANRRDEVEPALSRAVELAPTAPEPRVVLVRYLVRMGRTDRAEAAIRDAERALTGEQAAPALAQCYEEVGRDDRAGEIYRSILSAHPEDPAALRGLAILHLRAMGRGEGEAPRHEREEAEKLLNKLIALKKAPDEAAWAKRLLANLLVSGGGYERSLRALDMLDLLDDKGEIRPPDDAGRGGDESAADRSTEARVLAAQRGKGPRQAAIRILEKLAAEPGQLTPDDRFLLARLYDADGDWTRAREQMLELLSARGDDPTYLTYLARRLLTDGKARDVEQAEVWLARLEKAAPGAAQTLEIRARLLRARGRDDEAAALLGDYVRRDEKAPAPYVAAVLEDLGLFKAAEEAHRVAVSRSKRPDEALGLAQFLGRRGRPAEAIDICESAWGTAAPEAVAETSLAVLYATRPGDDQVGRVERRLDGAIRTSPKSAALLTSMAMLRDLQGRYRESEDLYRRALALDGRGTPAVTAMNNLAWLLSFDEGRRAEAAGLIDRAIKLAGPIPELLDTRAVVALSRGLGGPAIKDLEQALAEKSDPAMHFHLALAYRLAGDPAKANAEMRKARTAGFKKESLHPLERPSYDRLVVELAHR